MGDPVPVRRLTVEEYLDFENRSEVRHEYVDGFVFAMVGESKRHNRIIQNFTIALAAHLKGGPCEFYTQAVRLWVEPARAFYYPDVVVTCDPTDDDEYRVERPVLAIEVLSPGTESTDRREKRLNYSKLDSLREYA